MAEKGTENFTKVYDPLAESPLALAVGICQGVLESYRKKVKLPFSTIPDNFKALLPPNIPFKYDNYN